MEDARRIRKEKNIIIINQAMSHESRIKKFLNTRGVCNRSCRTRKAKLNLNVVEFLEEKGDVRLDSSLGSTVARRSVL